MKRFIISTIQFSLYFLGIIFLFIPNMFVQEYWQERMEYSLYGSYNVWVLKRSTPISFLTATSNFDAIIGWCIIALIVIVLALFALNAIFYYARIKPLSFFAKKFWVIAPVLPIALLILFSVKIGERDSYGYEANPSVLFYFEMGILIIAFLLDLFKTFMPIKDESPVRKVPVSSNETTSTTNSTPDSYSKLRELKKLLDEGVITQEEFDEKKKQTLQ